MYNKSSTSLAIISVLSILIVLFIAISNVEDAPIRRPFPNQGVAKSGVAGQNRNAFQAYNDANQGANFNENFAGFVEKVQESAVNNAVANNEENQMSVEFGNTEIPPLEAPLTVPKVMSPSGPEDDFMTRGINSELLNKVGFKNFYIKPRPFDGLIFETFDASMLSYLNVLDRKIVQIINGNEVEILRIYEFSLSDPNAANEVYSYLKTSLKDQLGVSVNETNQFGMSSFYINFQSGKDNAFLVVKTKGDVYALSYPKAENAETNYFSLVSDLLKELI